MGWVVGFHGEWSDGLTMLPMMLADAQVARWQSKYGRDPTDQPRSWLVNKIRTDIAMMGIKLNAQVTIKNLQNMHRSHFRPREREGGWSWSIRTGPACKARGTTHRRTLRPPSGVADVVTVESRGGQ